MSRSKKQKSIALSWPEAIKRVLRDAGSALHYAEIAQRISSKGLRGSVGATPAATVATYLSNSLREGTSSPFLRTGRGEYTLRATAEPNAADAQAPNDANLQETGALRALGMFWRRDWVIWDAKPQILGRQSPEAKSVNFAEQIGVYLLHDRDRVIYVGRAADSLHTRLKIHTTNRLGSRWDRFSWFGLRNVKNDGALASDEVPSWHSDVVIELIEAVLIESLEPPLNRRRGDNFSGVEYIQAQDPRIEKGRDLRAVENILKKMNDER